MGAARRVLLVVGTLALVASACGRAVPTASSAALSAEAWCAEYQRTIANSPLQQWFEQAKTDAKNRLTDPVVVAEFGKLERLAQRAPADIRNELKAMWSLPKQPMPHPEDVDPLEFAQAMAKVTAPARDWLEQHCQEPERPDRPQEALEAIRPMGDWVAVQSGVFTGVKWTLHRAEAAGNGECFAFEPDGLARFKGVPDDLPGLPGTSAGILPGAVPPGIDSPPLPPLPEAFPHLVHLEHQGKLPACGPRADRFDRSAPVTFMISEESEAARFNVVAGGVIPGTRSFVVKFKDGGQKKVVRVDDTFVVTYDAKRHISEIIPDIDGARIVCKQAGGVDDWLALACSGGFTGRR